MENGIEVFTDELIEIYARKAGVDPGPLKQFRAAIREEDDHEDTPQTNAAETRSQPDDVEGQSQLRAESGAKRIAPTRVRSIRGWRPSRLWILLAVGVVLIGLAAATLIPANQSPSESSRFVCDREVRGHDGDIWVSVTPAGKDGDVFLVWGESRAQVQIDGPTSLITRKGPDDWPLFVYVQSPGTVACGYGTPPSGQPVRDIDRDWR